MTLLPVVILGAAALLLHLALLLAVAPLLDGLADAAAALAAGGPRARRPAAAARASIAIVAMRPWRQLALLASKQPVRARNASPVSVLAPPVALAATLLAAALVPSFGIGMLTGRLADLPAVLAMLALARLASLLGGFDAGLPASGLAAVSGAVRLLLAVPGCALALYGLSVDAGTTSLEAMLAGLRDGAGPSAAGLLAAAGLALAALAAGGEEDTLPAEMSGADLALFRLQAALQRLVWIDLVTALLLPGSLAVAQSGPLHWLLGLLFWAVRVGAACLLLGGLRGLAGALAPASRRGLAGLSVLLGLLGPLLLLVGRGVE